jgi:hypothetical protein
VQVEDIRICIESCYIMGGGREGIRESNKGVELTKVKYTHSGDMSRNPFEYLLWN